MCHPPLLIIRKSTGAILFAFLGLALPACASQGERLVAYASSSGTGDVRTDGDAVVVVGDLEASLGIRTATGIPVFLVPPVPLRRDQWYARSRSRDYERRASLSEPLPSWARALFLEEDLKRLAGLGIVLTFDEDSPPATP